jgi:hypothetical protein
MYHTIVKRIATKNFERVNGHDYACLERGMRPAPSIDIAVRVAAFAHALEIMSSCRNC